MKQISENILEEICTSALAQEFGVKENACDSVSNTIGFTLENDFDIPAYTVKAPVEGKKHFVCVIPGEFVSGFTDTEFVIVDATLEQFSNSYPELVIESQSDVSFYDEIHEPSYTLKEETETGQSRLTEQ